MGDSVLVCADADPVELPKAEVERVVATTLEVDITVADDDKIADEVDFDVRTDSAPACSLVWERGVVNPDDDVDADVLCIVEVVEVGVEEGVVLAFDKVEEEGVDVFAAIDEDLKVEVDSATDVDVNAGLDEESDEEGLNEDVEEEECSADEVISGPASPFAKLVEVTVPTNQIPQPFP